jgi:two-component system OmpR family response regulator
VPASSPERWVQSVWTIGFGLTRRSSRVPRDHSAMLVRASLQTACEWYAHLMRVLVVEDDSAIAGFVAKGLTEAGYTVDVASDGDEGLDRALAEPAYDALVVDLMLPRMDGLRLIAHLRDRRVKSPVLILSARRSVDDRVLGLQSGGDDYLTKPFAMAELVARVQALIRRSTGAPSSTRLIVGDLEIDLLTREVRRGERSIELRPREFALLEYLARHPGRVISKSMILSQIWNYNFDPRTNVVDVLVHRLRQKIDAPGETPLIETRRGVGYVLRAG